MNESNSRDQQGSASPQRLMRQNIYVVPTDFDKTQTTLLPLDHYLTNKDVYSLVQTIFSETRIWREWVSEHPIDSHYYFSPPYTSNEALLLGYGTEGNRYDSGNTERNT